MIIICIVVLAVMTLLGFIMKGIDFPFLVDLLFGFLSVMIGGGGSLALLYHLGLLIKNIFVSLFKKDRAIKSDDLVRHIRENTVLIQNL